MKKGILFFFLLAVFAANAQQKQSLKDLLYSGKLKSDSGSVVRSSDDLTARIDTATKKPEETERPKAAMPAASEPQKTEAAATNSPATGEGTDSSAVATTAVVKATPVKSTSKIWKEYSDSLIKTLNAEVLPSKKIKKDMYFITVEYEIGTDGAVNVLNVTSSPENAFLQSEVKTRMDLGTPQLAPVVDSTGKARKVKRRYNFSVTKE